MGEDTKAYQQRVLMEIVTAVGSAPDVTLEQIQERLGTLYVQHEHAGETQAMTLITEAWTQIGMFAKGYETAVDLAAVAREVAASMATQRDAALTEYTDLRKAVSEYDRDHPLVDDLISGVEEMIEDDMMSGGLYITADPADDIMNNAMIEVTSAEAETFFDCLTGHGLYYIDEAIAANLRTELATFIKRFVVKVGNAEAREVFGTDANDGEMVGEDD